MRRKRKKPSHRSRSTCIKIHAMRRAAERCGIAMTHELHARLVRDIQSPDSDAHFIRKRTNRVSLWLVTISGERWRVVYDKNRQQIVTVLPKRKEDNDTTAPGAAGQTACVDKQRHSAGV